MKVTKQSTAAPRRRATRAATLAGLMAINHATAASENPGRDNFVILGPGLTGEYMGSDDYTAVPMLISHFNLGSLGVEIEGLDARAALFDRRGWRWGIAANLDTGRDEDIDNTRIANLEEIDTALNMGAFLSYDSSDVLLLDDNIEVRLTAYGDTSNVHNGAFATFGVSYALPLYIPWRFEFELEGTYGNVQYMDTYFGISASDTLASGLAPYKSDSSLRDLTFATNIGLFFNPKWGVFTRLSVSRLMGDAADSPIATTGDKNQYFAGIGLYYRF